MRKKQRLLSILLAVMLVVCPIVMGIADETIASAEAVVGDLTADQKVDASDALIVLQHSVKLLSIPEESFGLADVNGDSNIDASDALMLLQKSVGLLAWFPASKNIFLVEQDKTAFSLVYDTYNDNSSALAQRISEAFQDSCNVAIPTTDVCESTVSCEIVLDTYLRSDCNELRETLAEDEYAVRVVCDDGAGTVSVLLVGYTDAQVMGAVEYFISNYITKSNRSIPKALDYKGVFSMDEFIIETDIYSLRDPFILIEDGVYYAYGTGWVCYKNTSGSLDGAWEYLGQVAQDPEGCTDNRWAPEVHRYQGSYYMFTTYFSSKTGHRGCTVMRSESPEGPFVEISNGHLTPTDTNCIDGTLYVDPDGQPWMVYVDEWVDTVDNVGRMAAAKLSEDLTRFISEPIELFRANDPAWAAHTVTDGCYLYTTQDGELLMLWSNFDQGGYCVGIARSSNGRIDGTWTQDESRLFSKWMTGEYDGGHGMIFTDTDGQMYLSIHSPNTATADRGCKPVFVPIKEVCATLRWDLP